MVSVGQPGQERGNVPAGVASYVDDEMARAGLAGVCVAAFDSDELLWAGGFGTADFDRREPVRTATAFRCASVSKLVTVVMILRLVERGALSLLDTVNSHLPADLAVEGGDPTILQLLTHTSGLGPSLRGQDTSALYTWVSNDYRSGSSLADAVRGLRVRLPQGRIVYSNAGYNLLGLVAAVLHGKSFEDAARDEVLGPLGMDASGFAPDRSGPGVATPYGDILRGGTGPRPAGRISMWAAPMGGLWAPAPDLVRLGRMWLRRGDLDGTHVLSHEVVEEAMRMSALNRADLDSGWGHGPVVAQWRGRRVVGHDGGMPGAATRLVWLPEAGVGAVVLANGTPPAPVHRITSRVLEELTGIEREVPGACSVPGAGAVSGSWEFTGWAPLGLMDVLIRRTNPVGVRPTGDGRFELRCGLLGPEPAYLEPQDGGSAAVTYVWRHGWNDGMRAVLDGDDLWIGSWHARRTRRLLRRQRGRGVRTTAS